VADNLVTISAVENTVITAPPKATRAAVSDVVTVSAVTHSVIIDGVRGVNNITCITTPKMPIIDYVCILPSKPMGSFFLNIANVYIPWEDTGEFAMEMHQDIMLDIVGNDYVLRFTNTSEDYTGCFAVVSYIGVVA
jgi:hypothetical protein